MAKNLILDPILTNLTQILVQKLFSWILPLLLVRRCCKESLYAIQGIIMTQTWENGKKCSFKPKSGSPNFFHGLYLYCIVDIVASYQCMQFQKKLTNQTWENGKKPSFTTDFETYVPNLDQIFFHRFYL